MPPRDGRKRKSARTAKAITGPKVPKQVLWSQVIKKARTPAERERALTEFMKLYEKGVHTKTKVPPQILWSEQRFVNYLSKDGWHPSKIRDLFTKMGYDSKNIKKWVDERRTGPKSVFEKGDKRRKAKGSEAEGIVGRPVKTRFSERDKNPWSGPLHRAHHASEKRGALDKGAVAQRMEPLKKGVAMDTLADRLQVELAQRGYPVSKKDVISETNKVLGYMERFDKLPLSEMPLEAVESKLIPTLIKIFEKKKK